MFYLTFSAPLTYCLLINIHDMVSNADERQDPFDALVSNPFCLFGCWVTNLDLREEFVRFVRKLLRNLQNLNRGDRNDIVGYVSYVIGGVYLNTRYRRHNEKVRCLTTKLCYRGVA